MIKKITRCDKGEKPASKGMDGAVTVDVTALQIAAPRQWIYSRDIGGKPGTIIYPVRVTYTVKTFYRNRTQVEENWVRTINFYVNEFGEWQSGSEEPVKSPQSKDIPRLP
jgi:phage-related tail fiber protein